MSQEPTASRPDELPPYTHIPGITPHPISGPNGHMRDSADHVDIESREHQLSVGTHLFNLGFYWEAHEAWEHLWIALGRSGDDADIVKGLIKLAACGVKCLEANPTGAGRHASRAAKLLNTAVAPDWFELNIRAACEIAVHAAEEPPVLKRASDGKPQTLQGFHLLTDQ